jgi:integrase
MKSSMGRRRQSNYDLPPRMQLKHGAFYYVTSTKPRKWIRLHTDLAKARVLWAELENRGTESSPTLVEMIDRWLASPAMNDRAESTRRAYEGVSIQLRGVFEGFRISDVAPSDVARWLDSHHSKSMANMGKAVLNNVFNSAVRQGVVNLNPCREVKDLPVKARDRYITDDEFMLLRDSADPVLRVAMDISYLTGARISDILKIKLADIQGEGLNVQQKKTGKKQLFIHTPALKEAFDAAKALPRTVRGLTLLCTRTGSQYSTNTLRNMWQFAVKESGVIDVHFHDIRAKSATDAKKLGMDYQKLLGHTNKAMSERYIRLREVDQVATLPKRVG